ncbi:3'-5' exoribonuclease [Chromobacterium haemolyticum]|uniref:3'-5' exoribonuclease n=1 Tax=Chromobacterium haemolyticum TaxID=394935 RepID=UPI001316F3C5|nr:3'-5' exoribonuclease [Chromobacterium haemolyticum]BBH12272.1 hypothetical protein CH06BL_15200 [Chromobacterium haemolyticum]
MLIFLDTEFTDFIDCELISIGMVSEDGLHVLYLEVQDFDRLKCKAFVQAAVWSQLGKVDGASISKTALAGRLRQWFDSLPHDVVLACDSQHDRDLLADVLDGTWPANVSGWLDLREYQANPAFDRAAAAYHTTTGLPWHHALYDAYAHRAGWLAVSNAG